MDILKIALSYINWIDVFVVICLVRTSYIGYTRGFSAEVPRFLSLFGVIVLTYLYYNKLGQFLSDKTLLNTDVARNIAFIVLVIGTAIFFKIICILIRMVLRVSGPHLFEVIGGVIIGIIRGFLLASLILTSLQFLGISYFKKSIYEDSYLGGKVANLSPKTFEYFSKLIKR